MGVGFLIHVLFAVLVYKLVKRKGYDWVVALLLALLGLLGLIIYCFLKDKSKEVIRAGTA